MAVSPSVGESRSPLAMQAYCRFLYETKFHKRESSQAGEAVTEFRKANTKGERSGKAMLRPELRVSRR
jgi:hypothetical protein